MERKFEGTNGHEVNPSSFYKNISIFSKPNFGFKSTHHVGTAILGHVSEVTRALAAESRVARTAGKVCKRREALIEINGYIPVVVTVVLLFTSH